MNICITVTISKAFAQYLFIPVLYRTCEWPVGLKVIFIFIL